MKKLFLTSAVLAAFVGANAQEASSGSGVTYKPTSGALAVELGLSGGLLNTATGLNSSGNNFPAMLKVRYFLSDNLAVRASFNFSSNSRTDKAYKLDANNKETSDVGTQKVSASFYGFNIGAEKHFAGTERLSTYIGADLSLGIAGASLKEEKYNNGNYGENNSRKVKGSSVLAVDPSNNNTTPSRGGFGFGLRAVTGADYYIAKKLYLGAEAGWGFFSFRNSKIKTETTTPLGTSSTTNTVENKSDGGTFSLTPQVVASVRIGYIF